MRLWQRSVVQGDTKTCKDGGVIGVLPSCSFGSGSKWSLSALPLCCGAGQGKVATGEPHPKCFSSHYWSLTPNFWSSFSLPIDYSLSLLTSTLSPKGT